MQKKLQNKERRRWLQRSRRTSKKAGESNRPALTVYRSAKHIYAQVVEPLTGKTLVAASTRQKSVTEGLGSTGNVEAAKRVGAAIAEAAKQKQISRVVFNRNGFLYHGRVKALADAAREAGLEF
ncbi:MAG: 50S ribosomal protein L18 [Myxococcota bacterium]|nr:50S ribosomal protein L18 [Myxococcota bacterium]